VENEFSTLLEDIESCNTQLYEACETQEWQATNRLIEQRGLFLQNLSLIINSLNPQQVDKVGQLYQLMLKLDEHYLKNAQQELKETRNSLRAIKNAEKALPAYKAHQFNS
jgi:hypothetical protein